MQPADFYTGIVAELYGPLKSESFDPARYARFVHTYGEPALELGCGDGDPLLALRRQGIDVDGVDSSADMLDRCRRRAADNATDISLYHQRMEELDLPRRYRSIFLAGPTFVLLPDDDAALRALHGIRDHLEADGAALVPLFIPAPTPPEDFHRLREASGADRTRLAVSTVAENRDEQARTQVSTLRYQRTANDTDNADNNADITLDRDWTLHWHTADGFATLATTAGLTATLVDDELRPVSSTGSGEFTFLLQRQHS